eukprot:SAG31_NODE_8992_length_1351_cov_1.351438_1_plen_23_part_10
MGERQSDSIAVERSPIIGLGAGA